MSEPLKISVHVEEKRYQPTQEKTVVPDWDAKTVTPDKGYALNKVIVEGMPEPTESETFTENGTYDVGRIGTAIVNVDIDLQDKTVTPTEQTQTVEADTGYDGLDTVTVNPIPPEYVVPAGSVDITVNGQGIDIAGKATANVNVPGIVPTGTKQISITANGTTTEDVTDYADAEITVDTLPEKGLVFEDYDSDGYPTTARFVGTWTEIPFTYCATLFGGSSGVRGFGCKVQSVAIPEGVTTIGPSAFYYSETIKNVIFPQSLETIDNNAFYGCASLENVNILSDIQFIPANGQRHFHSCSNLTNVVFGGNVNAIKSGCFNGCTKVILYDFSHCTAIPPLYNIAVLGHASGCVIRIPAALSDTTLGTGNGWESATNWSALTNIVWEVV